MTVETPSPSLSDRSGASASPEAPLVANTHARLQTLPNQRRLTGEQAQSRSRLVRRLRYILPAIAVAMVGLFFLNTQSGNDNDAFLDDLTLDGVMPEEATMVNPKFAGLDKDGQPYQITAATAVQAQNADDTVALHDPKATMMDGDIMTTAKAKKGSFIEDEKVLQLSEDVTLERMINGQTYILRSSDAMVEIDNETVTTTSGVTGEGDNGRLRADTMQVFNEERRIVFEGNVRMKFNPDTLKDLTDTMQTDEPVKNN